MPAPVETPRFFLPEPLTPLFHTAGYAQLTVAERRRYNQLHAVYVHEQILFFEVTLADRVLGALLREPLPPGLAADLERFRADETVHGEMFRALNRRLEPARYQDADFHFVRLPRGASRLLAAIATRPTRFPLLVWLMLMLEERALHYGREILRQRADLEPHVVATHQRHLRDEVHHVRWDEALLDRLWPATSPRLRRLNAALFRWMVGEFFNIPRRASLQVLREFVTEHPALAPRLPLMLRELRALAADQRYHRSVYARDIVPRTFARFDRAHEFASMSRVLLAYRAREATA